MTVSRQAARAMLVDAVRTSSPSGHERAIAQLLAERMAGLGFTSHVDTVGNVIGEIGNRDGRTVVMLGHIDTVATLLPVVDSGDRLWGRGAVDAKGSLCCFICAAAGMASSAARFVVIGAVEEETSSRGARSLAGKYDPAAVFIGEPSGADAVVIGYKGRIGGSYGRHLPSGHIAGPQGNAAVDVTTFWLRLEEYCRSLPAGYSVLSRPEPSIRQISGDGASALLGFDIRIPEQFDTDAFLRRMSELAGEGTIRIDELSQAAVFPRTSPPARALATSMRAAGINPRVKVKSGTCDMNIVREFWNAPMVAYGPGDSRLDHSAEEHLLLSEYFSAIDILSDALGRLATEFAVTPCISLKTTYREKAR